MKLYKVRNNTNIRLISDLGSPPAHRPLVKGEILKFHNLDGMFSRCTDKDGNTVHLAGWAIVEPVEEDESNGGL